MGWAKFFEDNEEICNDRRYYKGLFKVDLIKPVDEYKYHCPVLGCNKAFKNKEQLFNHIRDFHHKIKPIILINEEVLNWGETKYFECIYSASMVYYNEEGCIVKLRIDNEVDREYIVDNNVRDLSQDFIDVLNKEESITLLYGEDEIKIKLYSVHDLDNQKMNKVIEEWDKLAREQKEINIFDSSKFNPAEKRCLEGMFNYYIACNTITNKKDRYEDAYERLKGFISTNKVIEEILKVIIFRFLWVDKLEKICEEDSLFKYIVDFINGDPSLNRTTYDSLDNLYIEDETKNMIEAIINFQQGHYDFVEKYLSKNEINLYNSKDANYREMGYLLYTRMYLEKGDTKRASSYYEQIKDSKIKKVRVK